MSRKAVASLGVQQSSVYSGQLAWLRITHNLNPRFIAALTVSILESLFFQLFFSSIVLVRPPFAAFRMTFDSLMSGCEDLAGQGDQRSLPVGPGYWSGEARGLPERRPAREMKPFAKRSKHLLAHQAEAKDFLKDRALEVAAKTLAAGHAARSKTDLIGQRVAGGRRPPSTLQVFTANCLLTSAGLSRYKRAGAAANPWLPAKDLRMSSTDASMSPER